MNQVEMIEESGRIVAIEHDHVWVETLRKAGCGRCDEPGGCGNPGGGEGELLKRLRDRVGHVCAINTTQETLAVGDLVRIGVPANAVLAATLKLYVLPLLMLLAGAVLGNTLAPGDTGALAGAFAGIAAAFVSLRWLAWHAPVTARAVILGRVVVAPARACPH